MKQVAEIAAKKEKIMTHYAFQIQGGSNQTIRELFVDMRRFLDTILKLESNE